MKPSRLKAPKVRILLLLLLAEIAVIPTVMVTFRLIQPRLLAALVASSLFVIIGFLALRIERELPVRSRYLRQSALAHLVLACFPVIANTLLREFAGFDAGQLARGLHSLANFLFLNLLAATAVSLVAHLRRK